MISLWTVIGKCYPSLDLDFHFFYSYTSRFWWCSEISGQAEQHPIQTSCWPGCATFQQHQGRILIYFTITHNFFVIHTAVNYWFVILTSNFQLKMKSWKDRRIHKKDFYLITISSDCVIENRQWIFGKEKYVMVNVYMFKNMHDVHFDFSILHIYQVHLCETYNITNKQFQFQTFIRQ